MSDMLSRTEPVSREPFAGDGVTICLAPPMARFSLRARAASDLETALKVKVPEATGGCADGMACLGPDEWLWRGPEGAQLGQNGATALSLTDIGERAVCVIVEGPRAAEILMAGCPLDLDRFAVDRATRTIFETVEIILLRTGSHRFEIEVWRSFTPWLFKALTMAAG